MEGRDVVATAQTGTGKTLAFRYSADRGAGRRPPQQTIRVLILSPTRELAIQIDAAFRQLAHGMHIRTAVVVGGMSESNQLRDIKAGAEVVIATPGRLCDYLDRRLIDLSRTATVVLDEADRMLDMGFLPSLRIILDKLPAKRQTMLFSATMEQSVAGLVASYVHNPVRIAVEACAETAGQIDLFCYEVAQGSKFDLLEHLLKTREGFFPRLRGHQRGRRQAREISGARATQGDLDPRRPLAEPAERSAAGLQRRCLPRPGRHRRGGARHSCG